MIERPKPIEITIQGTVRGISINNQQTSIINPVSDHQSRRHMNPEELKKRTKEFAHGSVKLAVALPGTALGKHVESQLVRCGTSVASNYRATLSRTNKSGLHIENQYCDR